MTNFEKNTEVLAPVGSNEQLIAAVRTGADAVYMGTQDFNARRNADNFTDEDFLNAVKYCRERGVKVYAVLNTIVFDDEFDRLDKTIELLAKAQVDGVIVQDLGVAQRIRELVAQMPLHASTQMTIHNNFGVELLSELGFSRAVLARELSFEEISEICTNSGIEIEVFVHGALCMSVSGTCYLSSVLGGRSGNRGLCAQPCRLNFKTDNREFALSLKDMSYIDKLSRLREIGVASLKIEGRMKRPEYVAAAVDSCKRALSGQAYDGTALRSVFSRSGFTDGYFLGKRNIDMFGYRSKEDVVSAKTVLNDLARLYDKQPQTIAVDMSLIMNYDGSELTIDDGKNVVKLNGALPQKAEKMPLDYTTALKSLSKTGATPYYLNKLSFNNKNDLFLRAAQLNAMRREGLELLAQKRQCPMPYKYTYKKIADKPHKTYARQTFVRFGDVGQVFSCDADKIILPILELSLNLEMLKDYKGRLVAQLPTLVFPGDEKRLSMEIDKLIQQGVTSFYADNIGMVKLLSSKSVEIIGGFTLNITNTKALEFYHSQGVKFSCLSIELSAKRIEALGGEGSRGAVVYGRLPLMRFRACPLRTKNGCSGCSGSGRIKDRMNIEFPIICHDKKYSTLYNSLPLDVMDKEIAGLDFELLYFTIESKDEARQIYSNYKNKTTSSGKKTGGLYFRAIQ